LIDVLLGKVTPSITQFGHDQVSTFGIGADLNQAQWSSIYRQLVAGGYLDADIALYGGLKLVQETAKPVLKGEQVVWMRKDTGYSKAKVSRTKLSKAASSVFTDPVEEKLWLKLKAKRTELAREQGVPPYVIFHDSTLQEMMKVQPKTLAQFKGIGGVGQTKLERYGEHFVEVFQSD
jgi:ATP-dependent DNA helicase RecQ